METCRLTRLQVLQVPIVQPQAAQQLLGSIISPRVPILGSNGAVPSTADDLDAFLRHTGALFCKDPGKWERIGAIGSFVLYRRVIIMNCASHLSWVWAYMPIWLLPRPAPTI